jgi:hypothetical protein
VRRLEDERIRVAGYLLSVISSQEKFRRAEDEKGRRN